MKLIFNLTYLLLLIALFYAVKNSIDPVTWNNLTAFLFDDYVTLWERHIAPHLPSLDSPIVLVLFGIVVLGVVRGAMVSKRG